MYLEVLHAPVVDQLFANLLLAVPVEEQVGQQQQQHRSVENGCQSRDIDFTKKLNFMLLKQFRRNVESSCQSCVIGFITH
jgi:hypothetical protein